MNYRAIATLLLGLGIGPPAWPAAVKSRALELRLSDKGELTEIRIPARRLSRQIRGGTELEGCTIRGPATARTLDHGGLEFRKTLDCTADRDRIETTLTERFTPASSSVHWEIEILGSGQPWTTPVRTRLHYPVSNKTRFWAAWSDPEQQGSGWRDPLVLRPLKDLKLWYGAPPFRYDEPLLGFMPFSGDLFSVPLAGFFEPEQDLGFSVVLSPANTILDLSLDTTAQGDLSFSRLFHRITKDRPVKFALDLVPHEADWRGGLRWMTHAYPEYFNPVLPLADDLAGTGAYSATEVPFDVEKLRKMGFRTNWKASFDFPYMGMFLPPLDENDWERYAGDSGGVVREGERGRIGRTSIRQMAGYSSHMRDLGFYVLNYFNVTEFGAEIKYPPPPRKTANAEDLWRDPNDFLYARLSSAIVRVPDAIAPDKLKFYPNTGPGGPYFTWGNGVILDCGEPVYRDFLLQQAQRHIDKLPASSGICIDRMDWLRLYNEQRDDGVSWFSGKPTRSLLVSWNRLLDQLGPMMHNAGKVIFCNNHDKRIDLLSQVDGIFDEFTYGGAPLNLTAFLTVRKTALGWTSKAEDLRPDPDAFFQKYLLMGVYPMAPFPGNDHSLLPSDSVDRQYLDYGPLLDVMRGKKWVLEPHAAQVPGNLAKVNLFEIPGGYAVPVTFGGTAQQVRVELRGLKPGKLDAEALHPGSDKWVPAKLTQKQALTTIEVPLKRGCAMLRLATGPRP